MVAVNIGIVNASLTAGSSTPIDILMNSMGLLVLNDIDNIVSGIFMVYRDQKEEDDSDLLAEGREYRDRVHAKWLSIIHVI